MVERKVKLEEVEAELAMLALIRKQQMESAAQSTFEASVLKIVRGRGLPMTIDYNISGFEDGVYLTYQEPDDPVPLQEPDTPVPLPSTKQRKK